jgi:hypothetical protein
LASTSICPRENDIRFAMLNALYDDVLDDTDDKHLITRL